jgi:uncharacterized protein YbjT (DUF2867 family)
MRQLADTGFEMDPDILVTGATGRTGFPLIRLFAQNKIPVRALIHHEYKRPQVERPGVEVVVGDFNDPESLDRALDGIERAYLVPPPSWNQVELQYEFIDAAMRSGLRHLVKLSALGTARNSPVELLRWHAEIEDAIRQSGIAWTFLHPHFFQENLLQTAETVRIAGALFSPLGKAKISTVSVDDVAEVAFRVLTQRGHVGKTYTITGPEAITFEQIAETLSEVVARPVRYVEVPFDSARQMMVDEGQPDWMADNLVAMMKTWAQGERSPITMDVKRVTGHRPTSIREFLTRNQEYFLDKGLDGDKI